jgi:hypothetical protein|tara:strand:+ start:29036 stop:29314 length:279 start_codon:yes stop_codon:yes gene_type:complete
MLTGLFLWFSMGHCQLTIRRKTMTKNTIEFSEQPLHDPLTQMFIQDFCNKCSIGADMSREQFKNFLAKQSVRDALNDRDMDKLEELIAEENK